MLTSDKFLNLQTQTPQFRLALIDNIPKIIDLRLAKQIEVNEQYQTNDHAEFRESVRQYLCDNLGSGRLICSVAEYENKIVSMSAVVIYRKIPSLVEGTGKIGYMTSIYTFPEYRKLGIAGQLMTYLVEQASRQEIEKLHLGATRYVLKVQ